jgi:hypothetical protein
MRPVPVRFGTWVLIAETLCGAPVYFKANYGKVFSATKKKSVNFHSFSRSSLNAILSLDAM